jgi:hypothetical protein
VVSALMAYYLYAAALIAFLIVGIMVKRINKSRSDHTGVKISFDQYKASETKRR